VHVASRDNPYQSSLVSERESHVQTPAIVRSAQSVNARFNLAVPYIWKQQQRLVEKDLLCFALTDPVIVYALVRVSRIPLKALGLRQIDHKLYMTQIYKRGQSSDFMLWNGGAITDMFPR
jgi:hypothetical protein